MDHYAKFIKQIEDYVPFNEEEARDRELMLACLATEQNLFTRDNKLVHFSASGWVVNPARTKILLAYHNIYRSWTWLGGHADGETDLLHVALREVQEESGVSHVKPVSEEIFSLESLTVDGHIKRGTYVSSHIHLNLTYLLEASEDDLLTVKADENSGVAWFPIEDALRVPDEPWMVEHVFRKLNRKLAERNHL
ncbi:MAG: NUDIX hydrolase [Lachnospiraceae bacterium]|nr:NUDIX hydrolase [Lachnospiraceae bacterium]